MKRSMWFFGLLLAVAGLSSFRTADIAVSRPDRAQRRSLAKLERSYEYIRKMYVDSVDMAPLVEEAIRSMVHILWERMGSFGRMILLSFTIIRISVLMWMGIP